MISRPTKWAVNLLYSILGQLFNALPIKISSFMDFDYYMTETRRRRRVSQRHLPSGSRSSVATHLIASELAAKNVPDLLNVKEPDRERYGPEIHGDVDEAKVSAVAHLQLSVAGRHVRFAKLLHNEALKRSNIRFSSDSSILSAEQCTSHHF